MKNIVCFHLFNDYSGSPKVLKVVLDGLIGKGYNIDLVTSKGGALDEISASDRLKRHSYNYQFSTNPIVTMLRYIAIQIYTFFIAWKFLFRRDVEFYINTILPIGPAIAGRMMGKRVVYHYHENAFIKGAFYKSLAFAMQKLATEIICVSQYQASFLGRNKGVKVIPNALTEDFVAKLEPNIAEAFTRQRVLMLGSLKLYKSPLEFIELAQKLPQFSFELIINDTQENVDTFMAKYNLQVSDNLKIYSRQADVSSFYNRATIVLNLSNKKDFIETFGLTALEAMSDALPVIVPTQGGIAEMVEDGANGYKIDVENLPEIRNRIEQILANEESYTRLASNAMSYSKQYNKDKMIDAIASVL